MIAILKSENQIMTNRGHWILSKSTSGWKLLVQWKYRSETWVPLKELKESHPMEVLELSKARGIDN